MLAKHTPHQVQSACSLGNLLGVGHRLRGISQSIDHLRPLPGLYGRMMFFPHPDISSSHLQLLMFILYNYGSGPVVFVIAV